MHGRVGLQSPASGVMAPPRLDRTGRMVVEIGGGKYAEDARRGRLYTVTNTAAVALTAALATTYTGLVVGNKVGSVKNVELLAVAISSQVAIPAAAAIGIMTGTMTEISTNAVTPRNRLIGNNAGPSSSCIWASSGGTIGTPVLDFVLLQGGTVATTAYALNAYGWFDLEGCTVLTPGGFAAIYASAALTAALICAFLVREVEPEQ